MNIASVQLPSPVSLSGVRFAVKLTPHGPANAVLVAAPDHSHGPRGAGGVGITRSAGCPLSIRVMSGSGPFGPSLIGVWQSLQRPNVTRYLPRATRSASDVA